MMARAQGALAVLAALGLHVAAFGMVQAPSGATSSGDTGAALATLAAVDASMAQMVQSWDSPPVVADAPAAPDAPRPDMAPALNAIAETGPQTALAALPALPRLADSAPQIRADLPVPQTRPKPRPKPQEKAQEKAPEPPATKPAAKPKTPSAGQAAQTAAGAGGGAAAGTKGTARAATLSTAQANDLQAGWGATIRTRIERQKRHPGAARGVSGTVTLRLTVTPAGALAGLSVVRSSGHAALDQAAVRAVRAARLPAAPKGLGAASYSFTLPMTFAR